MFICIYNKIEECIWTFHLEVLNHTFFSAQKDFWLYSSIKPIMNPLPKPYQPYQREILICFVLRDLWKRDWNSFSFSMWSEPLGYKEVKELETWLYINHEKLCNVGIQIITTWLRINQVFRKSNLKRATNRSVWINPCKSGYTLQCCAKPWCITCILESASLNYISLLDFACYRLIAWNC